MNATAATPDINGDNWRLMDQRGYEQGRNVRVRWQPARADYPDMIAVGVSDYHAADFTEVSPERIESIHGWYLIRP